MIKDNKRIMWSNYYGDYNPEDFRECYEDFWECYEECKDNEPDDYELDMFARDLLDEYLEEDAANIAGSLKEMELLYSKNCRCWTAKFVGDVDLGRWNGTEHGYKFYDSLSQMFELWPDCWYGRFYMEDGQFKSHQSHHDGDVNLTYYYVMNDDVSAMEYELDEGNWEKAEKYLHPMGDIIPLALGWTD